MPCIVCCFTEMCNFYLSFIIIFCCVKWKYIFYCVFVGQLSDYKWPNPNFINKVRRHFTHLLSCFFFFYCGYVTRTSYGQHKFNALSFHNLESVLNRLLLHYLTCLLIRSLFVLCAYVSAVYKVVQDKVAPPMDKESLPVFISSKLSHVFKVTVGSWDALGLVFFNGKNINFQM